METRRLYHTLPLLLHATQYHDKHAKLLQQRTSREIHRVQCQRGKLDPRTAGRVDVSL